VRRLEAIIKLRRMLRMLGRSSMRLRRTLRFGMTTPKMTTTTTTRMSTMIETC